MNCYTSSDEAGMRDEGHSASRACSLKRVWGGNISVSASVSTTQPNTSRRVFQLVSLPPGERGGSGTLRSPNK